MGTCVAQIVSRIYDEVYLRVQSSGNGYASASYSVNSITSAFNGIWAAFTASAQATYTGANHNCLSTAAATVTESISLSQWASDVLNRCGFISSSGGIVTNGPKSGTFEADFTGWFTTSPYANALDTYSNTIANSCTCGEGGK